MYRIMLVDDEPLILAGITSMLDWEAHDCRIVGKAVNGQQALDKMEELKPDIVITDIKMPAMDGLEFMRRCKERGYQAQFILLTNLEEFSLARQAIHLGAVEYLVKLEMTEELLAKALEAAVRQCESVRTALTEEPGIVYTPQEQIQDYFRRILVYDMDGKADPALEKTIRERFEEPVLVLLHFHYGNESFSSEFTREDQKKVMGFAEDIVSEMIRGFFDQSCLVRRDQNEFILVLSAGGIGDYQERIQQMGRKFVSVIRDYFEVSATVAVSQKGKGLEELSDLLYQVMCAMNYTYYDWSEPVIFYSEKCEESRKHTSDFNISFLKKDLGQSIRQRDTERFGKIMDQVIELLIEQRPARPQVINGCSRLYYFIMSCFEEENDKEFPYALDIVGQLNRMGNLNDMIQWICGFRDKVAAVLEKHKKERPDKYVELAQQYVQKHYQEKITLRQAAEELGVSQGHLSSMFKKQTGQTFTDYVNDVKVNKAKELIASHQYMMYEISDMLGFDTQYYFSTVFKKVAGCTPRDYELEVLWKKSSSET